MRKKADARCTIWAICENPEKFSVKSQGLPSWLQSIDAATIISNWRSLLKQLVLNNQNFVMDKETTRRDIRFSRKNRKCLVRGFFAGRIVTSSTPLKVSSRLRCRKYQGDGYDVDDFDSQEESLDPEMSLNKKRQSQSIIPINKWKLMYYHHPKEIHDSLLEMELTKSFQSSVPRIDSNKIISLTL